MDSAPDDSTYRVMIGESVRRDEMARAAAAAGWIVSDEAAAVVVVDIANEPEPVANVAREWSAVLAIGDAAAAYAAGATHWLAPGFTAPDFMTALAFAGRYARRLHQQPFEGRRRGDDTADGADNPVAAWLDGRRGDPAPLSLIVVALTRFEFVNAAFGRAAGDALLASAQARITRWAQETFGDQASIARDAGAQFIVATAGSGDTIAAALDSLDIALGRPYEANGAGVNLGSRIGIATAAAGEGAASLLRRAQDALTARAGDGGITRIADADGDLPLDQLAADLHHALERGEIGVVFQPQADMAGRVIGVEALARWEHPDFGPLGADRLFAAAERADLGIALSDHIQTLALRIAAEWPTALDRLRLSLNVTAADLARGGFASAFLARIEASGFARARVTVEIVETGLIGELDRASAILARLRGAGCRIAIDDFGTGYSSLAYLKALPIDYLKIDRSLTRDITGSERDRVIVRGVIAIARSLGLETIAEGVETEEERALLAAEGCDLYQGFLCSEPVGSAELVGLVGGATV